MTDAEDKFQKITKHLNDTTTHFDTNAEDIKLNDNNTSRPIVGVYELSSILTNTSELLANTPNLNEFLKDDDKMINDYLEKIITKK